MGDRQAFEHLLRARYPCVLITTSEEDHASSVVVGAAIAVKRQLRSWSVVTGLREGLFNEEHQVIADSNHAAGALRRITEIDEPSVFMFSDLLDHVDNEVTRRALREAISHCRRRSSTLVLIDHRSDWPDWLRADGTPFSISLPDAAEIERMIRDTISRMKIEDHIKIEVTKPCFEQMIAAMRGLTRRQVVQAVRDVAAEGGRFDDSDLDRVLAFKQQMLRETGLLETVSAGGSLEAVGGFSRLKRWLELRERGRQHDLGEARGILLLGVPGSGKSLCGQAIARDMHRPLLRLDAGRLYDRYVGESERRLREALAQAEAMSPVVLWMDEIEKGFAGAASHSTDGGLSQRMFGALLTWMQEHRSAVFLVATANDIDALPPELLRKGRFDEIFFADLPDEEVRAEIFALHLKRRGHEPAGFDCAALAAAAEGFSGAEIEQVIVAAAYEALANDSALAQSHLLAVIGESPPLACTAAEKVQALQQWARGRAVSVH